MQFLKTLFWVVVAVIAVIFATKNWTPASINLWGGMVVDVKLPVLVLLSFLLGLIPALILYRATRWRMQRRIDTMDRTLAELRPAIAPAGDALVPDPVRPAPGAVPTAVAPAAL